MVHGSRVLDLGLDSVGEGRMSISSAAADRTEKHKAKVDAPLADSCWIDRMRPVTPGEHLGWSVYLRLPQPAWRAARELFRRAFNGDAPDTNLLQFLTEVRVDDASLVSALEVALEGLAKEAALYRRWSGKP
jgi:hypothetical protein